MHNFCIIIYWKKKKFCKLETTLKYPTALFSISMHGLSAKNSKFCSIQPADDKIIVEALLGSE
jgi:hypothetical protein